MKQGRVGSGAASAVSKAVLILGLSSAGIVAAEGVRPIESHDLLEDAFPLASLEDVQLMDQGSMGETEGELWPYIAAVVTIDIGLATFFWGSYVPTMAAAGGGTGVCPSCSGRNHIPR